MDFEIVLACDSKNGIANTLDKKSKHCIPWNIPDDMKFFKYKTLETDDENKNNSKQNAIIMGRKTADTLKKPLLKRLNIVLSSKPNYRLDEGFVSFSNLPDALKYLKSLDTIYKVFVIGGANLADSAIKSVYCRAVNMTHINHDYQCNINLTDDFVKELQSDNYIINSSRQISLCKKTKQNMNLEFTKYTFINREEVNYLDTVQKILEKGHFRQTRNATTYSLFGEKLEFYVGNKLPLLTTKKMFSRGILEELCFFLRGDTDTKLLEDKGVKIWTGNTSKEFMKDNGKDLEEYDMGPMYGFQWRHFGAEYKGCDADYTGQGTDQLKDVINKLVNDPHSRRILMTTYNPAQAEEGVLYPCHGLMVQFYVEKSNRISLQMYQRSCDFCLGNPFNIASYGALLHIIVNLVNNNENRKHELDYLPGRVVMVFGDVHIYSDKKSDHVEPIKRQLKRKNSTFKFPDFRIKKKLKTLSDLDNLEVEDMEISNYRCHKGIKMKMVA